MSEQQDEGAAAEAPEDADEAFLKRQRDARFTVEGPAPEWTVRMFADVQPGDGPAAQLTEEP